MSGSQKTLRWSKGDSNSWSHPERQRSEGASDRPPFNSLDRVRTRLFFDRIRVTQPGEPCVEVQPNFLVRRIGGRDSRTHIELQLRVPIRGQRIAARDSQRALQQLLVQLKADQLDV
jgi:hypothetical protein